MDKKKLLDKARKNRNSITFKEIQELAVFYGFVFDRQRGTSHKQYKRHDNPYGFMNFQPRKGDKKMAKPYQVGQLVNFIAQLELVKEDE